MKIAVAGAGYVGLVTAACLAELGNEVICVDIDEDKISSLNGGIIPIYEPGLEELAIRNKNRHRLAFSTDLRRAIKESDIVFICVKPQDIDAVLDEIKDVVKNQLIVSIAAGIRLKHLENKLKNKRIIRVMPNINCIAGEMAAGFSAGKYATKEDIKNVSGILNSAGIAFFMKEDLLDAVTGISGSGPAFFAYFIDAFVKAGVKNGLPRETVFKLACQTALGTGRLLMEKNLSPDKLIAMVASKKGTTVAGLDVLKKHKAKNILIKTIDAAVKRSKELGR